MRTQEQQSTRLQRKFTGSILCCGSILSPVGSLNDHADREGRGLADGQTFSMGQKTWQWIDTPHVPHGRDCGALFDQTTSTLWLDSISTCELLCLMGPQNNSRKLG